MLDLEDWSDLNRLQRRRISPSSPPIVVLPQAARRRQGYLSPPETPVVGDQKRSQIFGQKRRRDVDDDGDDKAEDDCATNSPPRKRRRLRRLLTTSRLSSDYATPSVHTPGRTSLRQGIWARQKVSGRDLLRKAAILNRVSRKRRTNKKTCSKGVTHSAAMNKQSKTDAQAPASEPPRQGSPSPILSAFSEYENLDYEDDISGQEEEDDEHPKARHDIHSDFGKLSEPLPESILSLEVYAFDNASALGSDDIYTFDPGGKALGLILENENKDEVSHAPGIVGGTVDVQAVA